MSRLPAARGGAGTANGADVAGIEDEMLYWLGVQIWKVSWRLRWRWTRAVGRAVGFRLMAVGWRAMGQDKSG